MKLKFEGTKEDFESLFGIAVNVPVEKTAALYPHSQIIIK